MRLIAKEGIAISMVWSAYFMASTLIQDPVLKESAPEWISSAVSAFFWPAIIISGVSFVIACAKSALPAIIGWVVMVPLYLLGYVFAAKVAMFAANAAASIFALRRVTRP